MLDRIRNSSCFRVTNLVLLGSALCLLSACATKQPEPLVSDRAGGPESQIPWNEQQKWEREGQLGPMADRLQSR